MEKAFDLRTRATPFSGRNSGFPFWFRRGVRWLPPWTHDPALRALQKVADLPSSEDAVIAPGQFRERGLSDAVVYGARRLYAAVLENGLHELAGGAAEAADWFARPAADLVVNLAIACDVLELEVRKVQLVAAAIVIGAAMRSLASAATPPAPTVVGSTELYFALNVDFSQNRDQGCPAGLAV